MKTWQKSLIYVAPFIVIGLILYFFSDIVNYIILAWVLSMIGAPIHNLLNKYMNSSLAAGLTLLFFTLFLVLMVRLFVPPLLNQAKNLAGLDYNKMISGLDEPINDAKAWLETKGLITHELESTIEDEPEESDRLRTSVIRLDSLLKIQGDTLADTGIDFVINIQNPEEKSKVIPVESKQDYLLGLKDNFFEVFNPSQIPKFLGSFFSFFGNILVLLMSVFFIAFFFLKEKGLFSKMVSGLIPNQHEHKAQIAIDESSRLLIRYFLGLLAQVAILTVITTIILKLLGMQNALLMGFCFAVLNLVPYVGPILGNLFAVLIVISSNLDTGFYDVMLPKIIKTVVLFGIMQMVDNFIIQPNIFSTSVKAHPLEIFLIILVGAKLGGVMGMVLAIPLYTVLRVLAKVFFSQFDLVKKLTADL